MPSYDVVVLGAGSAGAAIAARLSEDPGRPVLLLEAGRDYRSADAPAALRGADLARALAAGAYRWPTLTARTTRWQPPRAYACGRGVGGSSAINGQMALRPPALDFRAWPAGWSWPSVLDAFVALEDDLDFPGEPHHGSGGPLPVARVAPDGWGPVSSGLAEAATASGHAWCDDANGPAASGAAPVPFNRRDGARVSTNDAYLEAARERANLRVEGDALVGRVVFSGGCAVAVEYTRAGAGAVVDAGEVICCAGAVFSPAILLRSGVGPAGELRALGVDVVADLPAVGRHLADHPQVLLTLPLRRQGRAAGTGLPGHTLLRCPSAVRADGDDLLLVALERGRTPATGGLLVALADPRSSGRVTLASAEPAADPVVDLDLLGDRADVERLRRGVRTAAALADAPALSRCAAGPLLAGDRPVEGVGDEALEGWLRSHCSAYHHAAGTCRMGSDPSSTVVDPAGRVHGVDGLRVADASVLPRIPRAPTLLVTLMLAERIARTLR